VGFFTSVEVFDDPPSFFMPLPEMNCVSKYKRFEVINHVKIDKT
jgi:hypothetical protein